MYNFFQSKFVYDLSHFRYIAIIHPLLHRNLSVKYSMRKRVIFYTLPVVVISIFVNIPKFLETKVVAKYKSEEFVPSVGNWISLLWKIRQYNFTAIEFVYYYA